MRASAAEIRRRAGTAGKSAPGGAVVRGLTVSAAATTAGYALVTSTSTSGGQCVALKSVTANVVSRDLAVLVDSRYLPGSCEHRAILDHEQEHVRIDAQALRRTAQMVERGLGEVAAVWAGRWVPESVATGISEAVNGTVENAVRAARQEADVNNFRLDQPESYARVQARCERW